VTPTDPAATPRPDEAGERSAEEKPAANKSPRSLSAAEAARLAAVFGEVMPSTTSDERGPDGSAGQSDSDDWLRRQVPPHHG
jgi:hypothetical protein